MATTQEVVGKSKSEEPTCEFMSVLTRDKKTRASKENFETQRACQL